MKKPPSKSDSSSPSPDGKPDGPVNHSDIPDEYSDHRDPWDWPSKYPDEARNEIRSEARKLGTVLSIFLVFSCVLLGLKGQSIVFPIFEQPTNSISQADTIALEEKLIVFDINLRILMVFCIGCIGGTTFSIKWLIHTVATGRWHLDRHYWRLFTPILGGVYACVVLTLFDVGFVGGQVSETPRSFESTAAFSFLIGYFSDGVSGLLSNIASAVFGTLDRK